MAVPPGLIVCEVKTRSGIGYGEPSEGVTPVKAARIRRITSSWLRAHRVGWCEIRFGVSDVGQCRNPLTLVAGTVRALSSDYGSSLVAPQRDGPEGEAPTMLKQPHRSTWDESEMHSALASHDLSTVYRLLIAGGMSQRQISDLVGQAQSEISEILSGRQVMAYDVLERIADGLGIPRGHMGLAYADAHGNIATYPDDGDSTEPEVDDDMISRRFLGMASAALLGGAAVNGPIMQLGTHLLGEPGGLRLLSGPPGELGKHDIAWIRNMTDKVRSLDAEHGGTSIFAAARGTAEQVVGALRASQPNRELQLAGSELCRIAAWSAFDAGQSRSFWQTLATALDLAREAGDTATVISIMDDAGRAEIQSGRHLAAAKLFELISFRRPPTAVGWGLLGSAYAPASPGSAKRALARLTDSKGADTPSATSMLGHVSLDLGDYSTAVAAFSKIVPQRSGRVAIQEMAPLAIAHLKSNEVDVGIRYAETALELSESVRSTQSADAMRRLSATLAMQKNSTAQDLAQRISPTAV